MNEDPFYVGYPVFRTIPDRLDRLDREVAAKEVEALLDEWSDRVQTRGVYSTTGFGGPADLLVWWVARRADDIQDILIAFRRTQVGRALEQEETFLGVTQPAEFAKDHQPAFVKGETPKRYICVYPFVRAPEWYLLEPEERGSLLKEHGDAGREYPDVLANTTTAFGLGDWEWILCFEADSPDRIAQLIRRLRATEARRYTKLEVPFVSGIRKDPVTAVLDLP